jgi:translocation and assembly module TamB
MLVIFTVSGVYVISTEQGLEWVFAQVKDTVPGKLSIKNISGRLIGPLRLTGLNYSSDEHTVSVDSISIDWKPLRLLFLQIHLADLNASGIHVEPGAGKEPDEENEGLPEIRLPLGLRVDNLLVRDISIFQSDSSPPFIIKEIMLKADMGREVVRIDSFSVLTPGFVFSLQGKVEPGGDYPLDLKTEWDIRPEGYAEISGEGELSGTMKLLIIKQAVTAPFSALLHATVHNILKELRWEGNLAVSGLDLQKINNTWPETGVIAHAQSTGTVSSFDITGTTDLSEKQYGNMSAAFSISRDKDTWQVKNLKLSIPGNEAVIALSGRYSQVNGAISFQSKGNWNSLSWPLIGEGPVVKSREGTFDVNGSPDKYGFSLTADITGNQIPHSDVKLSGTGTQNGIILTSLFAKLLNGELTGNGSFNWKPYFNWQASLHVQSVNPGVHWPDWPGKLDIKTGAKGGMKDGELSISIEIASLQGDLQGYPFKADAQFEMADSIYSLPHFDLSSGSAHLTASGSYSNVWDAQWSVRIPELGELFPDGKGEIRGQGKISGEIRFPKFTAHLTGSNILLHSYQASGLVINMDVDATDRENSSIDVITDDLFIDTQEIKKLTLKAYGKIVSHNISLSAKKNRESILLSADAGYKDGVWEGNINKGELDVADFGLWQLKKPAAFSLSLKEALLRNLCWINDSATVCLQTEWTDNDGLTGNADLSDIPLSLFSTLIPDVELDGTLEGEADILYSKKKLYGQVAFHVPASLISYKSDKEDSVTIPLERVRVEGSLNEESLDMKIELSLKERGHIKGTINLPFFTLPEVRKEEQAVSGWLRSDLKELDLIPLFISGVEDTKGLISTDLNVSGTLARPVIAGNITLTEGNAGISDLGINLKDIYFDVTVNQSGRVNVDGRFASGSGKALVKGELALKDPHKMSAALHVRGENFEAVRLPELWLVVSPDINIRLQDKDIDIDGSLLIPEALIEPTDLSDAIPASRDVYIISESSQESEQEKWKINSRVSLTLGDRVKFKGFGLTSRFTGGIHITEEPGKATKAAGELQILDGQYKAYGQDLKIEKGRLLFVGIIDDPGLDIRAVRRTKEVVAGVQVMGTLKIPEMRVFSIPSMDQSDALSYILFGRSTNQLSDSEGGKLYSAAASTGLSGGDIIAKKIGAAFGLEDIEMVQGETFQESSLVIGKYLSPKLYVSYGIGLFEPIDTLRMRYELSPRWMLESEYGIESGGDVLYKIDR